MLIISSFTYEPVRSTTVHVTPKIFMSRYMMVTALNGGTIFALSIGFPVSPVGKLKLLATGPFPYSGVCGVSV